MTHGLTGLIALAALIMMAAVARLRRHGASRTNQYAGRGARSHC